MEEEVAALRKARSDIDSKLDAALENITAWRNMRKSGRREQ